MIKTLAYNSDSLSMIRLYLQDQTDQKTPRDFEIRIDDLVVVRRTPDLSLFHLFKKSLTESSNEVTFIIYKGKSRRYDKYILTRRINGSPDSNMTREEYITHKIEEAVQKDRQEAEMARLKQKTKKQKSKISKLKDRVAELESKNKGDLQDVLQMASGFITSPGGASTEGEVNGISDQNIVQMISHYRSKFGEAVFAEALGIALQVAEHPKLIQPVKVFMNEQIEKDEKG